MVIPDYLIYEVMDGKPIYYRGYKEVLANKKKSADIRGYGLLQHYLLIFLTDFLKERIGKKFRIMPGEAGIHLEKSNNFSLDLIIEEKKPIKVSELKNTYRKTPPRVIIEVDTKADSEFLAQGNYYNKKTKKLLEFGVEKVVWIFTETKQIMVAESNKPWLIVNWSDEIEVLGEIFTFQQVIDEAEQEI